MAAPEDPPLEPGQNYGLINFTTPKIPPHSTRVRAPGGATTGTICATGTAANDPTFGPPSGEVWGKVYPDGTSTFPATPPTGDAGCKRGVIPPGMPNNWVISRQTMPPGGSDLPGVSCGAVAFVPNVCRVWVKYGSGGSVRWESASQGFLGRCDTDTECGGP